MSDEEHGLDEAAASRREEIMKEATGFIGECRESVPFGETFYVFSNGREFRSCTHTPPHNHPVS